MANKLYPKGRQKFLEGSLHWLTDEFKIMAVDTAIYTYNAAHEYLDDVIDGASPSARVGTDQTLSGKTSTSGVADAADPTFPTVTGPTVGALIIYKDSGASPQDEASCPLVAYIDDANGLPWTPDGGNKKVIFDNGANKIFTL